MSRPPGTPDHGGVSPPSGALTVCMIVRDEAEILPKFLAASEGLWDELAVMDTGSTDQTRELLVEAGAVVGRMEWPGNFSVARNASLAMASCEWVLVLDADEIVSPAFIAEVHSSSKPNACMNMNMFTKKFGIKLMTNAFENPTIQSDNILESGP